MSVVIGLKGRIYAASVEICIRIWIQAVTRLVLVRANEYKVFGTYMLTCVQLSACVFVMSVARLHLCVWVLKWFYSNNRYRATFASRFKSTSIRLSCASAKLLLVCTSTHTEKWTKGNSIRNRCASAHTHTWAIFFPFVVTPNTYTHKTLNVYDVFVHAATSSSTCHAHNRTNRNGRIEKTSKHSMENLWRT